MSEEKITIALVDDHPIVIEGLKSVINPYNHLYDLRCFANGASILSYIHSHPIDVVLLDISLPDICGLEVCKKILADHPNTKIIGLSNQAVQSVINSMLSEGAFGFILKEVPSFEILNGIEKVLQGEKVFSKAVQEILANKVEQDHIPTLTRREKQLIQLMAQGKTTSTIAEELLLSKLTIDTYRKNLLHKFHVKNSNELLVLLIEHKMI